MVIYIPAWYNRLGFSVSMTTSLLVDCYSIYATTSIFHFPEQCGDPSVYLFHHDRTLMAWPLIWYYLIALYMFIWVVTGQSPHQGHWALCCLWVRVMFITSIRVNLYIKALYFRVCISLAWRFIVPRGLHIRLGIEIMVWDGRHHLCAVHVVNDMQYVVFDCCNVHCVDVLFFSNMLFWGLAQPIVELPPFLYPRWQ